MITAACSFSAVAVSLLGSVAALYWADGEYLKDSFVMVAMFIVGSVAAITAFTLALVILVH